MRLPKIVSDVSKSKSEIVAIRGINWSDQVQSGDLLDSTNLSTRRYPFFSTRHARIRQEKNSGDFYTGVTALTAWGELVTVAGASLLYGGRVVGTVTAGEKQFAVVNTKMVIWPDKVYLDLNTLSVKKLEASASTKNVTFTENTLTGSVDLSTYFKAGDTITISGCTTNTANNKDVNIKEVNGKTLTVSSNALAAGTETGTVTLKRSVPDMDYICESENRLWGCSSKTQSIYASSLGDPTNFYVYEGLSTDSYALAVGSEGDFTGCCKLSNSVLFWKETQLHKLLGSYPAEYVMYTYNIEGVQKGCHKSLQIINEVLYYMGLHGVHAYSGGVPSLISGIFGQLRFSDAVGGSDGDTYFLSVQDGDAHRFMVYETRTNIWIQEDDTAVVDFARIGSDLYFLDKDGSIWLEDGGADDPEIEWTAQFAPFYETAGGRKTYSRLLLRVELPRGSYLIAETRCDGKLWQTCGRVVGREADVIPIRIAMNRCDKFELRLRGKGPCTVLSVLREFTVGSDV